jgi:hypothetical protein
MKRELPKEDVQMKRGLVLLLVVAFAATPVFAQVTGEIGFDLVPGSPQFSGGFGTAVTDTDNDIDTTVSVAAGDTFSTLVRLNGTQDLLGVTFDFAFPNAMLEVTDIRETRMDLDFSGQQSLSELNAIINFFLANGFPNQPVLDNFEYPYNDGTADITTKPGVLMDIDDAAGGDGILGIAELNSVINEFLANAPGGGDVPFWTEIKSKEAVLPEYAESVEIFDTKQDINATGAATDNTVVLLRRPETAAAGFGFDGDAILLEVVFHALPGASGPADITISNAQGILETFADINTDVMAIATVTSPSTVTIQ